MTDATPNESAAGEAQNERLRTPLYASHVARGARIVPFAGYDLPVQYPTGILAEHTHTRAKAGLFDVSHMGQAFVLGPDHETSARALETLVPADIVGLAPGRQRYTQLLNDVGGILVDLMVTRPVDPAEDGVLMLVVNEKYGPNGTDEATLAKQVGINSSYFCEKKHRAYTALSALVWGCDIESLLSLLSKD